MLSVRWSGQMLYIIAIAAAGKPWRGIIILLNMFESLLTANDKYCLTGQLYSHFITFSKEIIVYKEPLKTVNAGDSQLFGYGPTTYNTNINTIVSQTFSGIKVGPDKLKDETIQELHFSFPKNESYIKVQKPCADYIEFGKTEKIEVGGQTYDLASERKIVDYLGLLFYRFDIVKVN